MSEKYTDLLKEIGEFFPKLQKELPEVMQGFNAMHHAANKDGALSHKTKELIALGIGVSARCDGCISVRIKTLIGLGVTRAELLETLGVAIYTGGGASLMYAMHALKAYEELTA
ncbi:MAG: carboxymuconolactone decarboxylase family protein [Gammaproteobacteria bacterium]